MLALPLKQNHAVNIAVMNLNLLLATPFIWDRMHSTKVMGHPRSRFVLATSSYHGRPAFRHPSLSYLKTVRTIDERLPLKRSLC